MEYYKFVPNNQEGADCQLVTALNASIFLHKKVLVKPKSKRYKELLKMTGCVAGPCNSVEKSWESLKIKESNKYATFDEIDWSDLPLELKTWDHHYGTHSVLVIDNVHWCNALQLLNFDAHTTSDGWIFLQDLEMYAPRNYHYNSEDEGSWIARSYVRN